MVQKKLNLVLCWHMHQPWYRESQGGEYKLPWVYLHALKDYVDMAAHLEAHPKMRVVVNFAPILLEQLDDYAQQFKNWRKAKALFSEPMLNLIAGLQPIPASVEGRKTIIQSCLRADRSRMIDVYPRFSALIHQVVAKDNHTINEDLIPYLNDQFYYDLLCWYHIVWLGHSLKQRDDVKALIEHGRFFDHDKRNQLMGIMAQQFDNLIDRYRILADNNQIELSMSPYSHPIIPLLIDINSMKDAQPDAPMPTYDTYPGGLERARWHVQHGIDVFEHFFNQRPKGVWLSEGAVSSDSIALLEEFNFTWTATGEGVWGRSRNASGFDTSSDDERHTLFHSHQLPDHPIRLFFRDDGLADMIGFEYKDWIAEDASKNFIHNIDTIADYLPEPLDNHVVSVILDGENAWEYYPDNAFHFLGSLYETLAESETIKLITFSEASTCCSAHQLPKLCAGSWVYGSFSTWIGERDKNRGWDRLIEAKQCYDKVTAANTLTEEEQHAAMMQLAICEGSDWFWWFGDYNPSDSVRDFDDLYRSQLSKLYQLLKQEIPDNLHEPISSGGGGAENAGTMRRGEQH